MRSRNTALDHIKAVACLLIVCHHLVFYGPMADVLQPYLPGLMAWLDEYARMTVQVFLVVGGYWAAAALAPQGGAKDLPFLPTLSKRFVRLSLPYCAALVIAIIVNELVREMGFEHDSVSATPTWDSVIAHMLLLHSIAGYESLSAGVWYVAIDFQLYALCLLWLYWCKRQRYWSGLGQVGIVVATALSLCLWNRNSDWDIWALYFFGAYGLGMMAWWSVHSAQRQQRLLWVAMIAVLGATALWLDWRDRIALAVASAGVLVLLPYLRWPTALRHLPLQPLTWIGQRSYSIFLIHFPVCLLVNASVHSLWPGDVLANCLGVVAAVLLSIAAGGVLHAWTERGSISWPKLQRWQIGLVMTGLMAGALQSI
ncbi:acyltransferase family protein [Lampropedia aestuarii]|uniref:acyltransferase family protein n=1 Tax=Lampropedia aestuarii TaxID=2562762 RepID=UPI0024686E1E|nr:acyltransferase [Lampropedia aestuarii]MDH5857695.1 acyltransferase [Lampropedia aestuarii]